MSIAPIPSFRGTHRRGVRLMLLSTACFTANVLLIRALGARDDVSVWLVASVRFAVGLALCGVLYPRQLDARGLLFRPALMLRGLLGGVGIYGYYLTVVELGAGRATFINNTYVIWAGLLAVVVLHERFRPTLGIGAVAGLTGLGLLTNAFAAGASVGRYDALAIAIALLSAWIVVLIRQLHHAGHHTATIFAAQCVYGLLLCGLPGLWYYVPLSPETWALLVAAAGCAGAGQLAMTHAFRHLPVAEGTLLQMLVPVSIAVGGVVFFSESFRPIELLGGALILTGSALPAWSRPRG